MSFILILWHLSAHWFCYLPPLYWKIFPCWFFVVSSSSDYSTYLPSLSFHHLCGGFSWFYCLMYSKTNTETSFWSREKGFYCKVPSKEREEDFLNLLKGLGLSVFKGKGSECGICWLAIVTKRGGPFLGHVHSEIMPLLRTDIQRMVLLSMTNAGRSWGLLSERLFSFTLAPFCTRILPSSSLSWSYRCSVSVRQAHESIRLREFS